MMAQSDTFNSNVLKLLPAVRNGTVSEQQLLALLAQTGTSLTVTTIIYKKSKHIVQGGKSANVSHL